MSGICSAPNCGLITDSQECNENPLCNSSFGEGEQTHIPSTCIGTRDRAGAVRLQYCNAANILECQSMSGCTWITETSTCTPDPPSTWGTSCIDIFAEITNNGFCIKSDNSRDYSETKTNCISNNGTWVPTIQTTNYPSGCPKGCDYTPGQTEFQRATCILDTDNFNEHYLCENHTVDDCNSQLNCIWNRGTGSCSSKSSVKCQGYYENPLYYLPSGSLGAETGVCLPGCVYVPNDSSHCEYINTEPDCSVGDLPVNDQIQSCYEKDSCKWDIGTSTCIYNERCDGDGGASDVKKCSRRSHCTVGSTGCEENCGQCMTDICHGPGGGDIVPDDQWSCEQRNGWDGICSAYSGQTDCEGGITGCFWRGDEIDSNADVGKKCVGWSSTSGGTTNCSLQLVKPSGDIDIDNILKISPDGIGESARESGVTSTPITVTNSDDSEINLSQSNLYFSQGKPIKIKFMNMPSLGCPINDKSYFADIGEPNILSVKGLTIETSDKTTINNNCRVKVEVGCFSENSNERCILLDDEEDLCVKKGTYTNEQCATREGTNCGDGCMAEKDCQGRISETSDQVDSTCTLNQCSPPTGTEGSETCEPGCGIRTYEECTASVTDPATTCTLDPATSSSAEGSCAAAPGSAGTCTYSKNKRCVPEPTCPDISGATTQGQADTMCSPELAPGCTTITTQHLCVASDLDTCATWVSDGTAAPCEAAGDCSYISAAPEQPATCSAPTSCADWSADYGTQESCEGPSGSLTGCIYTAPVVPADAVVESCVQDPSGGTCTAAASFTPQTTERTAAEAECLGPECIHTPYAAPVEASDARCDAPTSCAEWNADGGTQGECEGTSLATGCTYNAPQDAVEESCVATHLDTCAAAVGEAMCAAAAGGDNKCTYVPETYQCTPNNCDTMVESECTAGCRWIEEQGTCSGGEYTNKESCEADMHTWNLAYACSNQSSTSSGDCSNAGGTWTIANACSDNTTDNEGECTTTPKYTWTTTNPAFCFNSNVCTDVGLADPPGGGTENGCQGPCTFAATVPAYTQNETCEGKIYYANSQSPTGTCPSGCGLPIDKCVSKDYDEKDCSELTVSECENNTRCEIVSRQDQLGCKLQGPDGAEPTPAMVTECASNQQTGEGCSLVTHTLGGWECVADLENSDTPSGGTCLRKKLCEWDSTSNQCMSHSERTEGSLCFDTNEGDECTIRGCDWVKRGDITSGNYASCQPKSSVSQDTICTQPSDPYATEGTCTEDALCDFIPYKSPYPNPSLSASGTNTCTRVNDEKYLCNVEDNVPELTSEDCPNTCSFDDFDKTCTNMDSTKCLLNRGTNGVYSMNTQENCLSDSCNWKNSIFDEISNIGRYDHYSVPGVSGTQPLYEQPSCKAINNIDQNNPCSQLEKDACITTDNCHWGCKVLPTSGYVVTVGENQTPDPNNVYQPDELTVLCEDNYNAVGTLSVTADDCTGGYYNLSGCKAPLTCKGNTLEDYADEDGTPDPERMEFESDDGERNLVPNESHNFPCPEPYTITNSSTDVWPITGTDNDKIDQCCIKTGLCSGNDVSTEDVDCGEGKQLKDTNDRKGTTKSECCEVIDTDYLINLKFDGDYDTVVGLDEDAFTNDLKNDIVSIILADDPTLDIDENDIEILKLGSGSIKVTFKIKPIGSDNIYLSKTKVQRLFDVNVTLPTLLLDISEIETKPPPKVLFEIPNPFGDNDIKVTAMTLTILSIVLSFIILLIIIGKNLL